MPSGIQTFNSDGSLWLDLTERLAIIYHVFNTGTTAGSFQIPDGYGDPWVQVVADSPRFVPAAPGALYYRTPPYVSWTPGTKTISWFFDNPDISTRSSAKLIIGFY